MRRATMSQYLRFIEVVRAQDLDRALVDEMCTWVGRRIAQNQVNRATMQAIIEGKIVVRRGTDGEFVIRTEAEVAQASSEVEAAPPCGVITVPDVSAAELVARAKREMDLDHLAPGLVGWDFYQRQSGNDQPPVPIKVRGKRYEVLKWEPGKATKTQEVYDHFKPLEADGNVGAFIAWITETKPWGHCFSIPSVDPSLRRGPTAIRFHTLEFVGDNSFRSLCLYAKRANFPEWAIFVAFRELPLE